MTTQTVNSQESLQRAIGDLRAAYNEHPYVKVSIKSGKQRGLPVNALAWVWYQQISRELGEDTPEGVHRQAKLEIGVPILRAEEPDFRELYDRTIKRLAYEDKIAWMGRIAVTSAMTTNQMNQFMDDLQKRAALRGVNLESQ